MFEYVWLSITIRCLLMTARIHNAKNRSLLNEINYRHGEHITNTQVVCWQ